MKLKAISSVVIRAAKNGFVIEVVGQCINDDGVYVFEKMEEVLEFIQERLGS